MELNTDILIVCSGISKTKELTFDSVDKIRTKPHKHRVSTGKFKSKLLYKADKIKVILEDGSTISYIQGDKRYDLAGYVAKGFIVTVNRKLEEFGVEYESAGNHKDSLGGGWHSDVAMFRHKDFYFAFIECSCR
jgi:hypothetical protein